MKIKIQFENSDYVYEIPVEKIIEFLPITIEQLQKACKEAIKRI